MCDRGADQETQHGKCSPCNYVESSTRLIASVPLRFGTDSIPGRLATAASQGTCDGSPGGARARLPPSPGDKGVSKRPTWEGPGRKGR